MLGAIATFLGPVGDFYRHEIINEGKEPVFLVLVAFFIAFAFIRTSARLMRSPKVPWWPGSVETGGLHIHHLVWGICLMAIAGFFAFVPDPESPWIELNAILFGIGLGLTFDEFALFLHLEDVYWSDEGRASIDAVILAAIAGTLIVMGANPLDVENGVGAGDVIFAALISVPLCLITFLKGKLITGVIGLFIFPVSVVGAIRLAKPSSPWARWRYKDNPRKLERSQRRHRRSARRIKELIGGAPSLPSPTQGAEVTAPDAEPAGQHASEPSPSGESEPAAGGESEPAPAARSDPAPQPVESASQPAERQR